MAYKYYSVLRPIAPGTFPKPVDNGVLQIYNYLQREEIKGIGKAYGFLFYERLFKQADKMKKIDMREVFK